MIQAEFDLMWKAFAAGGLVSLVLLGVFLFCIRSWFAPYLTKKGTNLADKEDIAALTLLVEEVKKASSLEIEASKHQQQKALAEVTEALKAQHALALEQSKAKHQLRVAAIDRRLEAHQQAYEKWVFLLAHVYSPDIHEVAEECGRWYNANCLYLEPAAREAFRRAVHAAPLHKGLVDGARTPKERQASVGVITQNFATILSAGDAITQSVALPALGEDEKAELASQFGVPTISVAHTTEPAS